jgi:transcriptional regulator with XRE-family HTH domain
VQLLRTKEWREAAGLTQRKLSKESGVGKGTIVRIENGESATPSTAKKIADTLNISVADLLESPPVPLGQAPTSYKPPEGAEKSKERREELLEEERGGPAEEYHPRPVNTTGEGQQRIQRIPEEVTPKHLRETADTLENIVERRRKRVKMWAEKGEVPVEGLMEMDAFCDAIYRHFQDTRIAGAADELWNSAPSDEEEEEARRQAGRILDGMRHLNAVAAEAHNTRRRLLKDIPEEMPTLLRELEEELERAREQQYRQVNG